MHTHTQTHTLYLLHVHLQTVLKLSLLLSTGGLGLNYIWAKAVVQSETQAGRAAQHIREVLRRGISLCNMPGASWVLANTGTALCAFQREGSKQNAPLFESSLSFHVEGQHSSVLGVVELGGEIHSQSIHCVPVCGIVHKMQT